MLGAAKTQSHPDQRATSSRTYRWRKRAHDDGFLPPLDADAQRRIRVLMVDDSDIVRKVTGRMLEKLGCDIVYASNGSEAVEKCIPGEYDLVLMDCQMPVLDGPSATLQIRSQCQVIQPRIVAFTANVLEENRQRCADAGMDDFITKPIDMDALSNVLASVP